MPTKTMPAEPKRAKPAPTETVTAGTRPAEIVPAEAMPAKAVSVKAVPAGASMRIGELAGRAGVSVRALRYYEEQGLLRAERSASGQRYYAEQAVERVRLIQNLYAAGLASRTIADLLPCVDAQVNTPESRARLSAERARIDAQIAGLIQARDRLDAVIVSSESPESGCVFEPA